MWNFPQRKPPACSRLGSKGSKRHWPASQSGTGLAHNLAAMNVVVADGRRGDLDRRGVHSEDEIALASRVAVEIYEDVNLILHDHFHRLLDREAVHAPEVLDLQSTVSCCAGSAP